MPNFYKEHYDVVVIGASLAGLSSALTLSDNHYNVLVLEQHNLPMEYRKVGYNCLSKFEEMAGLREQEYLDYDIVNYQHQVNIDFAKTIKEDK